MRSNLKISNKYLKKKLKGFSNRDLIPLSENLCQGEDDIGIYCWGRPTFRGWSKHWKGKARFI